jgi:hypothetical protein
VSVPEIKRSIASTTMEATRRRIAAGPGPKTQRGNQRKKLAAWSAGKQKNHEVEAGESISPSR